jgi:hypothetical protein
MAKQGAVTHPIVGPRRRREKSGIAEQIPGLYHGQRVVERRELGNDGACD